MSEVLGVVVGVLTTLTLVIALAGLAVRYVLLPWLRDNLVTPINQTNHQVTVNAHVSDEPTVLDRLDTLSDQVTAMDDAFAQHIAESGPGRHERKRP